MNNDATNNLGPLGRILAPCIPIIVLVLIIGGCMLVSMIPTDNGSTDTREHVGQTVEIDHATYTLR